MTKNFKLALALILSIMMILGSVSALAADGDTTATTKGSITVKPSETVTLENKTLKAYKILDATYSGTGDDQAVAYSIPEEMVSFFNSYAEFKGTADSASDAAAAAGKTLTTYVMDIMSEWKDNSEKIKNFEYAALAAAKTAGITPITGAKDGDNVKFADLDAGYYVIEDEGKATPIAVLMLDTVTDTNVEMVLKAEDKSSKKLKTTEELINEKADELGLGRPVNYILSYEIPDTTGFEYMYYMINDTLCEGLTFNPDSVVVHVKKAAVPAVGTEGDDDYVPGSDAVDKDLVLGTDYYLYYGEKDAAVLGTGDAAKTFIIALEDVVKSKFGGATVTVDYTATVNSKAIMGVNPNTNKANVEYSNNPDKDHREDKENYKGIPANKENHPTGVSPDKWTDTYTTKVTVYKVDGTNDEPLTGVEFTLTGTSKDVVAKAEEVYEIDPTGDSWLLNNGTYTTTAPTTEVTLEETTGPAGWVEMTAGETVEDDVPVRVVNDKSYRPYVKETDGTAKHYVIVEANNADYASVTTKYKKVVKSADADTTDSYKVSRTGVTAGEKATVEYKQLGAGTYTLSETGILPGYNGIADITFTLECKLPEAKDVIAGTEKAEWTVKDVKTADKSNTPAIEYDEEKGTFKLTIENNTGVELPSTGGVGTTIFYVAGSIMVLAAAILLITKRRMGAND